MRDRVKALGRDELGGTVYPRFDLPFWNRVVSYFNLEHLGVTGLIRPVACPENW